MVQWGKVRQSDIREKCKIGSKNDVMRAWAVAKMIRNMIIHDGAFDLPTGLRIVSLHVANRCSIAAEKF